MPVFDDEAEGEQHRRRQLDRSTVKRRDVDEAHLGDWDRDQNRGDREDVRHPGVDTSDELVVSPNNKAQGPRADYREKHRLIGEKLFSGKDRDHFGHDAHCGQQHDVHLGVAH